MKKNEEDCTCTDECLGYLTMNCKEIETLEEGFDRIFDSIDYIEFDYASFEQGAKWNQERSYSEEDMQTAWNSSEQNMRFTFSSSLWKNITFEQWLEQFKKK